MNTIRPANLISEQVTAYNHSNWLRDGTTIHYLEKLNYSRTKLQEEAENLAVSICLDTNLMRTKLVQAHTIREIIKMLNKEPEEK